MAGYYPRILHVINTLKNFRSRREKSASTLAFFLLWAVGSLLRRGPGAGSSHLAGVTTDALSAKERGWCLEMKESLSELQGRDLECLYSF